MDLKILSVCLSEEIPQQIIEYNNILRQSIEKDQEAIEDYLELDYIEQLLHYLELCDDCFCLHCESLEYRYNVLSYSDSDF